MGRAGRRGAALDPTGPWALARPGPGVYTPGMRGTRPEVRQSDGLRLDMASRKAFLGCLEVPLAAREFEVLVALLSSRGRVVTRASLGRGADAAVGCLRRKLGGFSHRI